MKPDSLLSIEAAGRSSMFLEAHALAIIISDTASIDPRTELSDDVEIGPYCVIGPDVRIGRGTRLIAHVCVLKHTSLGADNVVSPFTVLGGDPDGGPPDPRVPARLEIGDRNIIREGVTIHRGEVDPTKIGNDNRILAGTQIGHDGLIGDRVTIGQGAILGAHVHIESHASLSPGVGIHPYVTIGASSYIGAQTYLYHDVPPYMVADGNPAKVRCINIVGLKRGSIDRQEIDALHEAHRLLYRARMELDDATEVLETHGQRTPLVEHLLQSLRAQREGRHGRSRDQSRTSNPPETSRA